MSWELAIWITGAVFTLIVGGLGFNLTLYPITPGDVSRIRKYKFLFGILSLATAVLVVVQGVRGELAKQVTDADAKTLKAQNQADMGVLRAQTKAANDAQRSNTEIFTRSFASLSDKVSKLQTQVATEDLQKRLIGVQNELANTQKALAPPPKAALTLTFPGFKNPQAGEAFVPIKQITLPATLGGNVKVPLRIANLTDADAIQGHLSLIICNLCKFAKEPEKFIHLKGTPEQGRYLEFPHILASVALRPVELDIAIPQHITDFEIGMQYRCRTCVLNKTAEKVKVYVTRP